MVEVYDESWQDALEASAPWQELQNNFHMHSKVYLSRGSFGHVYWLQKKHSTSQPQALKVVKFHGADMPAMWAQELHIHHTLNSHPNIVALHGSFLHNPDVGPTQFGLLLELCDRDLFTFFKQYTTIDIYDATLWTRDICTGLGHMHDCSIMHRDLTPRNCLLCHHAGKNMQLKISDFGASCFLAPNNSQKEAWPLQGPRVHSQSLALSRTTYNYAAPEVINHQAYSFPADVWSTGIILWQMLQDNAHIAAVSFNDS